MPDFSKIGEVLFGISIQHEAGYICAMLFIIPGFPFITSGIDLAKLDMRSGTERLMYALIIILVAAMSAWIMALLLHLKPVDFIRISLPVGLWILFRFLASFCGRVWILDYVQQSGTSCVSVCRDASERLPIRSVWNWWTLQECRLPLPLSSVHLRQVSLLP